MLAGADGCRAGWVVIVDLGDEHTDALVLATFDDVLALGADVVGIDIPIGLPTVGPRTCDVAARARLGSRRSSVFPAPVRAVLGATDHADAVARSRAACGRGVSIQAWNLVAKIAEVDSLVVPGDPVFEVHPELSFATLAGAPLATRKKGREGRAERLALLAASSPTSPTTSRPSPPVAPQTTCSTPTPCSGPSAGSPSASPRSTATAPPTTAASPWRSPPKGHRQDRARVVL